MRLFLAVCWLVTPSHAATPQGAGTACGDLQRLSHAFRESYQQACSTVVLITSVPSSQLRSEVLPHLHPLVRDNCFRGVGSGIIVSSDGYVLCNHHLVAGAGSIVVTLADQRAFEATVVGSDSLIDIALLSINARDLPIARLAEAESLQIGDWVLAVGHPQAMGSTLTHGIVSALERQTSLTHGEYTVERFIRTDAGIDPGNSGGPLLNLQGEVVGINSFISTRTRCSRECAPAVGLRRPRSSGCGDRRGSEEQRRPTRPVFGRCDHGHR